jgi:hypothetical protein
MFQQTSLADKVIPSLINVFITFTPTLPIFLSSGPDIRWKISWIALFFLYNLSLELTIGRCLGMVFWKTYYERSRSLFEKLVYSFFYTLSFSTLLFWIVFPFDLLLLNLFILQLPCIFLTGNTLHGFIGGRVRTVSSVPLSVSPNVLCNRE